MYAAGNTEPESTHLPNSTLDQLAPWLPSLLAVLAYLPTLGYGFVWDDQFAIVGNATLRDWHTPWQILAGKMDPALMMYRPVTGLVQFFEFQFFGLHPWGYHLTSLLLHAVACALFFRLALALCADRRVALVAASIFAVHAVHLEAVAFVSTVADPLVACFICGAMLAYLCYRRQRTALGLGMVCIVFFLGLWTKETAIVLPVLFAAYEFFFAEESARSLKVHIKPALAIIAVLAVYVVLRHRAFEGFLGNETNLPFSTMVFTWPSALLAYLRMMVWPHPLSPFYDLGYVTSPGLQFWAPLALLAFVAVALGWLARELEGGALAGFCSVGMLVGFVPVLDLNIYQLNVVVHDRFTYIPSAFFALLVSWLLWQALRKLVPAGALKPFVIASVVLLAWQSAALLAQEPHWANEFALWSHAAKVAPRNTRAASALADQYLQRGNLPAAESQLEHLVELVSAPRAFFQLGQVRMFQGKFAAAEAPLRQAVALVPDRPAQHLVLAQCLEQLGKKDEAVANYRAEAAIPSQFQQQARERLAQLGAGAR